MKWPDARDWVFSAKTFVAAMLALYVALLFNLSAPYWSMTTAYIVANPLAGATVSKALYRTLGTLLGAVAAVIMVPSLVGAPVLLVFAVSVWAGCLLYASMLQRTSRSYVFMLAGYTLPLIALPSVMAPQDIFDVAVARSEEIIVGIVCSSIVGSVVFPLSMGPVIGDRVGRWLQHAGHWAEDVLLERNPGPGVLASRQRLAAGISELEMLIGQLSYDGNAEAVSRQARALRERLLFLLPVLSSLADRFHALSLETREKPPAFTALIRDVSDWVARGSQANDAAAAAFQSRIAALAPPQSALHQWHEMIYASLLLRLKELVDLWHDCLILQRKLVRHQEDAPWKPALRHRQITGTARHYDYGLMLYSALSVVCASFAAGLLWIVSGWSDGAYFMAMTTLACCFFGTMDQPAGPMRVMLTFFAISQVVAGFYLFDVFPRIHDFELIVLVLAPALILGGGFLPRPEMALMMMLLIVNGVSTLTIQGRYHLDFALFVNQGVAVVGGVAFALVWTLATKPFGAELAARRLVRAGWRDMAALAAGTRSHDHANLASRTVDRLGQLIPRISDRETGDLVSMHGLAELRTGYNILALQRDRRALSEPVKRLINDILLGTSVFFRDQLARDRHLTPSGQLMEAIDRAMALAIDSHGEAARNAVEALVGLRRSLFPEAPGVLQHGGGV